MIENTMITAIRVLVDMGRQLAYAQIESPEGQATYEIDARAGDVFERVARAVEMTNRAIARRKTKDARGTLDQVAKML